jgi:hypothetical protein
LNFFAIFRSDIRVISSSDSLEIVSYEIGNIWVLVVCVTSDWPPYFWLGQCPRCWCVYLDFYLLLYWIQLILIADWKNSWSTFQVRRFCGVLSSGHLSESALGFHFLSKSFVISWKFFLIVWMWLLKVTVVLRSLHLQLIFQIEFDHFNFMN